MTAASVRPFFVIVCLSSRSQSAVEAGGRLRRCWVAGDQSAWWRKNNRTLVSNAPPYLMMTVKSWFSLESSMSLTNPSGPILYPLYRSSEIKVCRKIVTFKFVRYIVVLTGILYIRVRYIVILINHHQSGAASSPRLATMDLHFFLSSAHRTHSPYFIPVHLEMSLAQVLLCAPLRLTPSTFPSSRRRCSPRALI